MRALVLRRILFPVAPAFAVALVWPAPVAVAASTAPPAVVATTPAPPPPISMPAPAPPVAARIGLTLAGTFRLGGRQLGVAGRRVRIEGRIVPYIAGERVTVRIWFGHVLLKQAIARPRPTRTKRTATFSVRFTALHSGIVHVVAIHARSAAQARAVAKTPALLLVAPKAGPGARGPFVALLQQQLAALGYAVPRSGVYDAGTQRAVLAFRKVNGLLRVTTLSPLVVDRALRGVGGFHVRYPGHGRHVEANLAEQVLALIDDGRVVRTYVISSGKPSTPTVLGSFRFYSKTPGTNAKGMVDSNYFFRGYAIHGYFDVPAYNASHGCLRVPIPDAAAIYAWVRIGDGIDVYI
jgi:peptidoglycan hydrolase-like protein with peptidoglycan-binding domain